MFARRCSLPVFLISLFTLSMLPAGEVKTTDNVVPTALKSNLAWWSADDKGSHLTVVNVSVPADLNLWTDTNKAFTIDAGQPGPSGENNAFKVMENDGATWRWLVCTPEGYVVGPFKLQFFYKSVGGASVWTGDGSSFYPDFEFLPNGVGRIGTHPYIDSDASWFNVSPARNGFYKVDLWIQAAQIRSTIAISTVSGSRGLPSPGDSSRGLVLSDVRFSQSYVTELKDLSPNGANVSGEAKDAPFFQSSREEAGLLINGSCLWQPDSRPKFLSTTNAKLCGALSGRAPSTVIALVRRHWSRGEDLSTSVFFQAVAGAEDSYSIGITPGDSGAGKNFLFAGVRGKTGPVATRVTDTEWNVVAVINTGTDASIYLLDGSGAKLVAGPTATVRGTISSVRVGVERSALREMAVWGEALDIKTAQAQAAGMVARAGGWQNLNTFRTFDGVTTETRTKSAPYHWRDDSGTAFFDGACWILGGAVETVDLSNDVWKSTDYGATWTEVPQTKPFALSGGGAAFPLTIDGREYLYRLDCYGPKQFIYRSTDGSHWEKMCEKPPWIENHGQAVGVLGKDLFVMGGQPNAYDPKAARNCVYKSSDGGATWQQLEDAPWTPRAGFGPLLSTWKDKIWVVHGGTFAGFGGGKADRYDDVWTFDGTKWERVLEHTPWPGTYWNTNFVLNDELFILGGKDGKGLDHRMMWRTKDGVNWKPSFPLPWGHAHESCATQTDKGVLLAPTDWGQTTRLLK